MTFDRLLKRSAVFADHLHSLLDIAAEGALTPRAALAQLTAEQSIEHADALRMLMTAGVANSATSLLRLQYETLLRAAWAMYSAKEIHVDRLLLPLDAEGEQKAKNLPGAEDMLDALQATLKEEPRLAGLVNPLTEIRAHSWRAMNSYVHAGIHSVARRSDGFPEALAHQVVLNSNGMLHMAYRLLVRLTDRTGTATQKLDGGWVDFADVLPVLTPVSAIARVGQP